MAAKLRDPKALANAKGSKGYRRRVAARKRRHFVLGRYSALLLWLLLAFAGAGAVVWLLGWEATEQGDAENDERAAVTRPPEAGWSLPEGVPDFDAEALGDRIEEIVEGRGGTYGVAVLEPISGTGVSLRNDEEFVVASIGKLPAFATLYRAAARGELDLEEEIYLRSTDIQGYGTGDLQAFPVGHSLSLRETAYRLVNHSDNTAWAMLDRRLGADKISAELENMGIKNSRYSDYNSGYYTTPNDVLLLLGKISDPLYTSEKLSNEMLDAMTDTSLEDRIPEKLPSEVRVAHKTGSYAENFGDAGVVFYTDEQGVERSYSLVVLAKGAGEPEARDVIQNVSLAVYEELTGTTVDPGWSRHGESALESGADELTTAQPVATENSGRYEESAGKYEKSLEPARSPLVEKPSSESWRNATPGSSSKTASSSNTTAKEPTSYATPGSSSKTASSSNTTAKEPASYSRSSAPASPKGYGGDRYSKGYEDWYSEGYEDWYSKGYGDGSYSKGYEDWEYGWW